MKWKWKMIAVSAAVVLTGACTGAVVVGSNAKEAAVTQGVYTYDVNTGTERYEEITYPQSAGSMSGGDAEYRVDDGKKVNECVPDETIIYDTADDTGEE